MISDLQTDLGALNAIGYAMKEKLGEDFKSIDDERINPEKKGCIVFSTGPIQTKTFLSS